MTDQLRQAAQAVIKAWDNDGSTQTMEDLRAALVQQAEPVQEQKYEKRIAPYSTTLSMILNTAPPQQQAEPVQENKTLIEWKEQGEAIMAQAGVGFRLGAWWADRPWRQK